MYDNKEVNKSMCQKSGRHKEGLEDQKPVLGKRSVIEIIASKNMTDENYLMSEL